MKGKLWQKGIFGVSLSVSVSLLLLVLFTSTSSAYAPVSTYSSSNTTLTDFISNQTKPGGFPTGSDWVNTHNWAIAKYDTDPTTWLWFVGNDSEFSISDSGALTNITGGLCRWGDSLDPNSPGCNPWGSYSLTTSNIYYLHLTDTKYQELQNSQPGLITFYDGNIMVGNGKTKIKPEFSYSVTGKDITATDKNVQLPEVTPTGGYTIKGYSVEWTLWECSSWTDVPPTCEDSEIVDHKIQDQNKKYEYTVSTYKNYKLEAQYLVQECYRYASYPDTPDHCVYVDLGTELPDYDFTSTTVRLNINGDNIAGDTADADCNVAGYCEPPSPYEDCSTYGADLIGGFGCHLRNFGTFLKLTLQWLFVPSGSYFNNYWTELTSFLNDKLGFIYQSLASILSLLASMIDAAATEECTYTPQGSLYGSTIQFNLCKFEEINPAGFTLIVTLMRSLTVVALIFAFNRKYHEILEKR